MTKTIYIVGAKSLGHYGGFETFVDELTDIKNEKLSYVVCVRKDMDSKQKSGIEVLPITVLPIGPAKAILYDVCAILACLKHARKRQVSSFSLLILACRIGPFAGWLFHKIRKQGGRVLLNPDGQEYKRGKWAKPVQAYWHASERKMVTQADLVICDALAIEANLRSEYGIQSTTYIPYGVQMNPKLSNAYESWLENFHLIRYGYYLVVGRLVPENAYDAILAAFMDSNVQKDLVLITNENPRYLAYLDKKLGFGKDRRIHFVGSVYDRTLLASIRQGAWAYIHGHTVGGTNPSLLEAMSLTRVNLLHDVVFNREVGQEATLYWTSQDLKSLLERVDKMSESECLAWQQRARKRMEESFAWDKIASAYDSVFLEDKS